MNREAWLTSLAESLRPVFRGMALGRIRVSCGWPSRNALGRRSRTVGQCFAPECSKDGVHEICVSPLLDDPLEVAGTLTHELAHAAAGIKAGHGKKFVKLCRAVGLTKGEPRQVMPGPYLEDFIRGLLEPLGAYPHRALTPVVTVKEAKAPGVLKLVCPTEGCGCEVRIARKLLEKCGPPVCACGGVFGEDGPAGGEGDS